MWRGHPHKIFQKDSGVRPKDCWKIQAITNWLGMGRSSWRVKKTSAVSLTTANHVLAPAAVTFVTGQVIKPEKLVDLRRRAMLASQTAMLSLAQTHLWRHVLCHGVPQKPANVCLYYDVVVFQFWNSGTVAQKRKGKMWWKWLHIHPRRVSC